MPKSKQQKQAILGTLQDKLKQSKSVVFSSDTGLDVKTVESIRGELKDNNAEYLVTKKTLLQKATADMEAGDVIEQLEGSIALTLSDEDEISGVKVIHKFAKNNEKLELGGGILESKFILPDMVKKLAALPSRDQLLSQLLSTIQGPLSGMVRVLSGNTRDLVGVLSAIRDQKQ